MENLDAEHASEPRPQQPARPERPQRPHIRWRQWITLIIGPTAMHRAGWRRWIMPVSDAVIGILLLGGLLIGIATAVTYSNEQHDKAALDRALVVARTQYHVPPARLQPIVDTEQRTVAATGGSF